MLKVLFPWKQNNTKKVLFAMEQVVNEAEPSPEELPPENLPLLPCHVCNRTFLPKPLKKHIPICEQALRKRRKPFDSLKQRVEGTDMAPFYQKSYLKRSSPEMSSQAQAGDVYGNNKVSKWREKHYELQNTIKNAKGSTKPDMTTHPPSSNSSTPNRKTGHLAVAQTPSNERCPVCDRSFGPKAFDRHVEFCKEQKNRVQVHKSPAVVQQAKERLDARINYRVPPLRQSKRSLIRDKYCPSSQTNLLHRSNSINQGKSTTSISTSVSTMGPNRRQTISHNERNVERNNNKKETTSKARIDRTIGDCGDTKESTKNDAAGNPKSFHTKRTIPAKKINKTEVNDGLQGITVSSLSVEKDTKLVTWKDTVKGRAECSPSISLTTTNRSNTRRKNGPICNDVVSGTLRNSEKPQSFDKVVRSRLLMEKLNKFVSRKKKQEIGADPSNLFESLERKIATNEYLMKEKKSLEERELKKENRVVIEDKNKQESKSFSDLTLISEEEEEVDVETPMESEPEFICKKRVSFDDIHCNKDDDFFLDVTQDTKINDSVAETSKLALTDKENFSDHFDISSSSEDTSVGANITNTASSGDLKDISGDECNNEEGSSLCLRLPLEGLESKVQLSNDDLDPDQKLKKNIKSFYEIMKTGKCKASKREQLNLLESSKDITFLGAPYSKELDGLSVITSGSSFFEKNEIENASEKLVELTPKLSKNELEAEFDTTVDDPIEPIENNHEMSTAAFGSNKKVTFRIVSRQSRSWKTRKKFQKCRMCVECFIRKVKNRKGLNWRNPSLISKKEKEVREFVSTEEESFFDSPETLQKESCEMILDTPAIIEDLLLRGNKSANNCLKAEPVEPVIRRNNSPEMSRSLPNLSSDDKIDITKSSSCGFHTDSSLDYVIPTKRRKMSPSFPDGKREIEKNLRQNITKIREKKKKQEPPLILDYENIELGSNKASTADILYMNEVFASSLTTVRSDLDSANEYEDDGIQEYGDDKIESWEAFEEELMKELERKRCLTRCESPTNSLPKPRIVSLGDEETDNKEEYLNVEIPEEIESSNTLKNSSACTIVNMVHVERSTEKIPKLPSLLKSRKIRSCSAEPHSPIFKEPVPSPRVIVPHQTKVVPEKIPCRLPRIIPQNKQTTPLRPPKASSGDFLNLPVIGNRVLQERKEVEVDDASSDKLVQVPSENERTSACFNQQMSGLLVDNSSSFNWGDFAEGAVEELSSTTPTTPTHYDPFEKAHLQLMELIEDDNHSVATSPVSTLSSFSTPTIEFRPFITANSTPKSSGKRASVIDPPYGFQDPRASRDLDKEFELLESLMNNNIDETSDERRELGGEDADAIDPRLINEQDNLSIPERVSSDEHSPSYELDDREIDEMPPRDKREIGELLTRNTREFDERLPSKTRSIDERLPSKTRSVDDGLTREIDESLKREVDERLRREVDERLKRQVDERLKHEVDERLTREIDERLARNKVVIDERLARDEVVVIDERQTRDKAFNDERMPRKTRERLARNTRDSSHERRPTRLSIKPMVRSLPLIRPDQVRLAPDGSSAESQTVEGRRGSPGTYVSKVKARSKMRIDFSPETQKSKGNRRLGTSSFSLQSDSEVRKTLDEEMLDVCPKEQTFIISRTPTAEELYPDNPIMYEEFKKYEEMYRREKEGRSGSSKKQKKTADFGINIDDSIKSYGDSAYGSLNRKQHETSDLLKELDSKTQSPASTPNERLPKFCHECGNRYPVAMAKFCVECGVKRLVL